MDWLSIVGSVASVATAIGVFVAGWQIRLAKQLARTQFEDTLTQQFREIIWKIPVDALIGLEISEDHYQQTRDDFSATSTCRTTGVPAQDIASAGPRGALARWDESLPRAPVVQPGVERIQGRVARHF